MKKILQYLVVCFIITACSSNKFKDYYNEVDFVKLNGQISSVEYFSVSAKKPLDTAKIILIYNNKKLKTKQTDIAGKHSVSTIFIYDKKNRLIEQMPENTKDKNHIKYHYDKNDNLVHYQKLWGDSIKFEKRIYYDKKNNPIKEEYLKNKSVTSGAIYINDYSERSRISTFYNLEKPTKAYSKTFYDKKGNIIKSEYHRVDDNILRETIMTYDEVGNIITRDGYLNGKPNFKSVFKHLYDSKNNLIKTEIHENGNLIQTEYYKIHYRR